MKVSYSESAGTRWRLRCGGRSRNFWWAPALLLTVTSVHAQPSAPSASAAVRAAADSFVAIARARPQAGVWPDFGLAYRNARAERIDRLAIMLGDPQLQRVDDAADVLLRDNLREAVEAERGTRICRRELWSSLGQINGWQLSAVNWARQQMAGPNEPDSVALHALLAMPAMMASHEVLLRSGMQSGYVVPIAVVDAVVAQLDRLAPADPITSPLVGSLRDRAETPMSQRWISVVRDSVYPAIARYRTFLRSSYRPVARPSGSLSTLPDGRACYASWLREQTSTHVDIDAGMAEARSGYDRLIATIAPLVERLTGQRDVIAGIRQLRSGQSFAFSHRDSILPAYRRVTQLAASRASRVITGIAAESLAVLPYSELEEKADLPPRYISARGGKPAQFLVNLGRRERMSAASAAAHEAYPGHHLQAIAARQVSAGHPAMREMSFGSFGEGWGIYAEELGDEMGLYDTDLSRVGYLIHQSDVFMAFYLDAAFHSKGWTRQMLVDTMMVMAGRTQSNAEAYADRHAATPGQLATYYVGWQSIRSARAAAERILGSRFDARAFNFEVIRDGSIALATLRNKLDTWVARQRRSN